MTLNKALINEFILAVQTRTRKSYMFDKRFKTLLCILRSLSFLLSPAISFGNSVLSDGFASARLAPRLVDASFAITGNHLDYYNCYDNDLSVIGN